MNPRLLPALAAAVLLAAAHAHAETATPPPATAARTDRGIWIDVRSSEEFADGHLAAAVNIPLPRLAADIARRVPDKNTPVHLYCRSGRRAEAALHLLTEMGYTDVRNRGGYRELRRQGMR